MPDIPPSTFKQVKLDIQYKIMCTIVLFYCLKFIILYSLGTVLQCLEQGVGIFGFGHFLGWFFGFVVCCGFQFFHFIASGFSAFWQKYSGFSDFGDRCGFQFFHFGGKSKTELHRLSKWFLWLCCIINCPRKLHFLLLQECLLEIYLFCRI